MKFRIRSIPLIDDEAINLKSATEVKNEHIRTKERKIGDVVEKVVEWRKVNIYVIFRSVLNSIYFS